MHEYLVLHPERAPPQVIDGLLAAAAVFVVAASSCAVRGGDDQVVLNKWSRKLLLKIKDNAVN